MIITLPWWVLFISSALAYAIVRGISEWFHRRNQQRRDTYFYSWQCGECSFHVKTTGYNERVILEAAKYHRQKAHPDRPSKQ